MTDKRFTIDEKMLGYLGEFVCDNGVRIRELSNVVDLLNEFHERNERLKEENQKLAQELQETEGLITVLKEMVLKND